MTLASRAALAAVSAVALTLPLASPASAATASDPIATGLAGPLDLSVARTGSVFVAQAFAGVLTRHGRDGGEGDVVASLEGGEIAGVDATWASRTAYVQTAFGPEPAAALVRLNRLSGKTRVLADLQAYEETENPDGDVRYGFSDLEPGCTVAEMPMGGTEGYPGIVEAHPYAVAAVPGGFVVADAAANALLKVTNGGTVSTLAVLPPVVEELTREKYDVIQADIAAWNEEDPDADIPPLDPCVIGHDYAWESVPTDVELAPDGTLLVSALTGGPESPAFGARGKVYEVDRRSGEVTEVGDGFAGAVDLAVDGDGDVFVAELFGMQVSQLVDGGPRTHAEVVLPGALEWSPRTGLIAAADVFGEDGGSLVLID